MAVTTRNERFSFMSMGDPWLVPPVVLPAGSVVDSERLQLLGLYPGFAIPLTTEFNLVDAAYVAVKRYVNGKWMYYAERFDDRQWPTVEDVWALDCAVAYPVFAPDANLSFDKNIVVAGASTTMTADAAVFASPYVGNVIRAYGGIATITSVTNSETIVCTVNVPFSGTLQGQPGDIPPPAASGDWTIAVPTTTVYGLYHLEGATVSALADGNVVDELTVTNGSVTLPQPASMIVVGLPYIVQLQSLPLEIAGGPTIQGKRKNISALTVRLEQSRGMQVGSNQFDFSAFPAGTNAVWGEGNGITQMIEYKDRSAAVDAGSAVPLYTGDERVNLPGTWRKPAQCAIQQVYPLPLTVLAIVPEITVGDDNG